MGSAAGIFSAEGNNSLKTREWFAGFVLVFFLWFCSINATAATQSSTDRLTFELAYTHKILADEKFLAGETAESLAQYRQAENELGKIGPVPLDVSPGQGPGDA